MKSNRVKTGFPRSVIRKAMRIRLICPKRRAFPKDLSFAKVEDSRREGELLYDPRSFKERSVVNPTVPMVGVDTIEFSVLNVCPSTSNLAGPDMRKVSANKQAISRIKSMRGCDVTQRVGIYVTHPCRFHYLRGRSAKVRSPYLQKVSTELY